MPIIITDVPPDQIGLFRLMCDQMGARCLLLDACPDVTTTAQVKQVVAHSFGLSVDEMTATTSGSRKPDLVRPRACCYTLLAHHLGMSRSSIGLAFKRDQSTITYALDSLPNLMEVLPQLRKHALQVEQVLFPGAASAFA